MLSPDKPYRSRPNVDSTLELLERIANPGSLMPLAPFLVSNTNVPMPAETESSPYARLVLEKDGKVTNEGVKPLWQYKEGDMAIDTKKKRRKRFQSGMWIDVVTGLPVV